MFADANGTGGVFYTAAQPQDLGFMNNNAVSVWNRTTNTYCLFDNSNHTALLGKIPALTRGTIESSLWNRASSVGKVGGVC